MTSHAFHTPFESLMSSVDKRGGERWKKMVRMNNNHQAQHVIHTHKQRWGGHRHTHTRKTTKIKRRERERECWTYLLFLCVQRQQTARLNRKRKKKQNKRTLPLYRSFKCFYVSQLDRINISIYYSFSFVFVFFHSVWVLISFLFSLCVCVSRLSWCPRLFATLELVWTIRN